MACIRFPELKTAVRLVLDARLYDLNEIADGKRIPPEVTMLVSEPSPVCLTPGHTNNRCEQVLIFNGNKNIVARKCNATLSLVVDSRGHHSVLL